MFAFLGGLRDESEIRGIEKLHRCDAGKNSSKSEKAGTSNPVFVLDD
jgi:ATP-dependent Lon protease